MSRKLSNDIVNNLLCAYRTVPVQTIERGRMWYADAREEIIAVGKPYGVSCDALCAATAALSPGSSWERNVNSLRRLLGGDTRVGSYGEANVRKALRCLTGESPLAVLSGPKVVSFYQCLATGGKHPRAVTIDRHMKRICAMSLLDDRDSVVRPHEYDWYARHIRVASYILQLRPACLQAILWCHWLDVGAELIAAVRPWEDIAA
jgi:hypothetical protein